MNYRDLFLCQDCDDHEPCEYHNALADKYGFGEPDYDAQREGK